MNAIKRFSGWVKKSLGGTNEQFFSLVDTEGVLFNMTGRDYRFGTQSRDFLIKAYGLNPYVFMVIDRICSRLTEIDKIITDTEGVEVEPPEDLKGLLKKPNSKEDLNAFLYRLSATYLAAGEVFITRDSAPGEPDVYRIPTNYNVLINQDSEGNPFSYRISYYGHSENYLPGDVLHLKRPDITLDTNHGFSNLRALRRVWESNNEVWTSEAALHRNKGISGVLYSDANRPLTPDEEKKLQKQYDLDHTGSDKFGKIKVSTSKLGFLQMGMNPNDLKSVETRIEHLRTICAAYNVDSKLFGDPAASTYNNMSEAQKAFIVNAVLPLSKKLLPPAIKFIARSVLSEYVMQLDTDSIHELQISKEHKSNRLIAEVQAGILTADEARGLLYPELQNTT